MATGNKAYCTRRCLSSSSSPSSSCCLLSVCVLDLARWILMKITFEWIWLIFTGLTQWTWIDENLILAPVHQWNRQSIKKTKKRANHFERHERVNVCQNEEKKWGENPMLLIMVMSLLLLQFRIYFYKLFIGSLQLNFVVRFENFRSSFKSFVML